MEEMVEKVARAICFACDASHISGLDIPERQARIVERRWQRHVPAARAAIEAMKEPSPEMGRVGAVAMMYAPDDPEAPEVARAGYTAMISAALSPPLSNRK